MHATGGADEEMVADGLVDVVVDGLLLGALLLLGRLVDVRGAELVEDRDWGVCDGLDAPLVPVAFDVPGSSDSSTRTVSARSATSAMTDASNTRRRRQYTDGGCDPTG